MLASHGQTQMVGISWEQVADCMTAAASIDPTTAAEVDQVVGLYHHLESSLFIPFSPAEVAMEHGRLWRSIARAAYHPGVLRKEGGPDVSFPSYWRGNGSAFGYSGLVNGLPAWFGVWPEKWAELADTPYWLQLVGLQPLDGAEAADALRDLDPHRPSVWQQGDGWLASPTTRRSGPTSTGLRPRWPPPSSTPQRACATTVRWGRPPPPQSIPTGSSPRIRRDVRTDPAGMLLGRWRNAWAAPRRRARP